MKYNTEIRVISTTINLYQGIRVTKIFKGV